MKKLKNLWRSLTFRWLDVSKADPKSDLYIHEVNPESENMTDCLGITDERAKVLFEMANRHFDGSKSVTECIAKISREVLHANELYFCSIVVNRRHQNPHSGIIQAIISGMRGKNED